VMAKPEGASLLAKITGNEDNSAGEILREQARSYRNTRCVAGKGRSELARENHSPHASGFTLIELILAILLLSILSVTVVEKWPTGMDTEAAAREFKRAVRYAQHMAMTREFITTPSAAWGISVSGNRYTIQRQTGKCVPPTDESDKDDPDKCAEESYRNRALNDSGSIALTDGSVWFNGLGEPIDETGAPLGAVTYVIAGVESMTICSQTGYLVRGASCP